MKQKSKAKFKPTVRSGDTIAGSCYLGAAETAALTVAVRAARADPGTLVTIDQLLEEMREHSVFSLQIRQDGIVMLAQDVGPVRFEGVDDAYHWICAPPAERTRILEQQQRAEEITRLETQMADIAQRVARLKGTV